MEIEWLPSEKTIAKIKFLKELREKGLTYREIASKTGHHFTYIYALMKWGREKGII